MRKKRRKRKKMRMKEGSDLMMMTSRGRSGKPQ